MENKKEIFITFNRINWIDWSKSICIFLVVLGHTHLKESQSYIIQYIYTFHMPLFFMLSGLLCKKYFFYRRLIKKDFIYLIIPYCTYVN
jgi:acyltransferase